MQGQSFVLVPEDWLNEISEKLDRLLDMNASVPEASGATFTTEEAAVYLNVDRNTLYRWAREGTVPHRKAGSRLFFSKGELDEWTKERAKVKT